MYFPHKNGKNQESEHRIHHYYLGQVSFAAECWKDPSILKTVCCDDACMMMSNFMR